MHRAIGTPVRYSNKGMKRIFIVGCPRSGTTLVQSILAAHSTVISFKESQFFKFYLRTPWGYWQSPAVKRLLRSFVRQNITDNESDASRLLEAFSSARTIAGQMHWFTDLLDRQAMLGSKSVWIEKSPDHLFKIGLIERHVPDAHFVHVIRKPASNIAALHAAAPNWEHLPSPWLLHYWHWRRSFACSQAACGRQRHTPVFYEDLATHPAEETARLLRGVGLPQEEGLLERRREHLHRIIGSNESWKKDVFQDIQLNEAEEHPTLPWYLGNLRREQAMYEALRAAWLAA